MRIAAALTVFWLSVACVSAQNSDLAILDEIGYPKCEELIARLDSFFANVTKDSGSKGYIVVHGGLDPIVNLFVLRAVEGHVAFRKVPSERIVVLSTQDSNDFRIKFWKSKNNSKPKLEAQKIGTVLPATFKRIGFADDIVDLVKVEGKQTYLVHDCEACCLQSITNFKILSDLLQSNPEFDAEFAVRARSNLTYKKVADLILKDYC
ncbi:MAG: hypothetical protein DMF63_10740 [Acidobacteria bacterium]|nr:MAG: hypothetical protein DMF63_10740 [Acidobacteriota bacterium]